MRDFKTIIEEQRRELRKDFEEGGFIERSVFLYFQRLISSKIAKVITGVRRCGKSVFSAQLLEGKKYGYVNFDDEKIKGIKTEELNDVLNTVYEVYGDIEFLFLDEVQNVEGWELFANRLQRQGLNLVITGSNAKLLSKELATHLTGRHYSIELFPFSFKEFLRFKNVELNKILTTKDIGLIKNNFNKYILNGGFPEALKAPDPPRYLDALYSAIITKDILLRHKIKYARTFRDLAEYTITNFAREISFNNLKKIFKLGSDHTAKNYLTYLEEAYLVFLIEKFSFKKRESLVENRKVYAIDTGIIQTIGFRFREDLSHLYENVVAIELLRNKSINEKKEIYYWKNALQEEVDFVVKEGLKVKQLIQVCYDVRDPNTKKRELRALLKASKELNCNNLLIITNDYEGEEKVKNKKIKYISLWKWLLE